MKAKSERERDKKRFFHLLKNDNSADMRLGTIVRRDLKRFYRIRSILQCKHDKIFALLSNWQLGQSTLKNCLIKLLALLALVIF